MRTNSLLPLAFACALSCDGGGSVSVPPADPSCTPEADIEDGENADAQIIVQDGRSGYLYTYQDEVGTTLEPSGDDFRMQWGGAHKSRAAMRIHGQLAQGEVYAGMGMGFLESSGPYDASKYKGISFLAKIGDGEGVTRAVRVTMPDANTDPKGGVCKECHNEFGISFSASTEWTRYTIMFDDMKQEDHWGDPRPAKVDATKVYGVHFQVAQSNAPYDLWVDDVSFVGCGG